MVCAVKFPPFVNPVNEPSPQRIKLLTAAIRRTWSPQRRASRALHGRKRAENMTGVSQVARRWLNLVEHH